MRNLTRGLAMAGVLVCVAGAASAHHGWAEYDPQRPVNLAGTIRDVRYANPHVTLRMDTPASGSARAGSWTVVLAPVARMRARGITEARLRDGATVRVIGQRHRRTADEVKIERIVIGRDTAQIRY